MTQRRKLKDVIEKRQRILEKGWLSSSRAKAKAYTLVICDWES